MHEYSTAEKTQVLSGLKKIMKSPLSKAPMIGMPLYQTIGCLESNSKSPLEAISDLMEIYLDNEWKSTVTELPRKKTPTEQAFCTSMVDKLEKIYNHSTETWEQKVKRITMELNEVVNSQEH